MILVRIFDPRIPPHPRTKTTQLTNPTRKNKHGSYFLDIDHDTPSFGDLF
jgi:hypothetical protein